MPFHDSVLLPACDFTTASDIFHGFLSSSSLMSAGLLSPVSACPHESSFFRGFQSAASDDFPSLHSFCCVRRSSFTTFILLCQTLFLHCIHSAASASLQSFAAVRLSLYSPQLMPAISRRSASIIIATSFLKSTSLFQPSSRSAFSQLPQRNSTSAGR